LVTDRLNIVERKIEVGSLLQHEEPDSIGTMMPLKITRSESDNDHPKFMVLPPFEQVLPIVQIYLQDFNSV
jgi:hypothetical protein